MLNVIHKYNTKWLCKKGLKFNDSNCSATYRTHFFSNGFLCIQLPLFLFLYHLTIQLDYLCCKKNSHPVQLNLLSSRTVGRYSSRKRIQVNHKSLPASPSTAVQGLTHGSKGSRTQRFAKRQRVIAMLTCERAQENECVSGSVGCVRVCG